MAYESFMYSVSAYGSDTSLGKKIVHYKYELISEFMDVQLFYPSVYMYIHVHVVPFTFHYFFAIFINIFIIWFDMGISKYHVRTYMYTYILSSSWLLHSEYQLLNLSKVAPRSLGLFSYDGKVRILNHANAHL